MDKDTVKDLTLMLMYLTSWEERLVPDLHEKHDRPWVSSSNPPDLERV